ncbi:hypothetical protein C8F04DRAFT_1250155 [Mycena alexandri]|uniref:Uncharacterized protein n=1 Tax=Mycena alexandri TaxID=1745969 RepID=A0AAD6TFU4_9AGAR|nr:hypothetical protein C8F04DRAFT_1250155 [Mycena alexandri]
MARSKRERRRIPKAERRNLRLWAEGARENILTPHLTDYGRALDRGWLYERKYWKSVCREFHARVDWRIEDHEEPELRDYDPKAVIPPESLPEDEEVAKLTRMKVLNERIRRWFLYRLRKTRKQKRAASFDPTKDPFSVLLAKLSGVTAPPKARQAFQQFMHESYSTLIAPTVAEKWARERETNLGASKQPKAGFRAQVARELFAALEPEEQTAIAARAKEEAATKKAAYQKAMKDRASTAPADRQKCIDALPEFVGPIVRGIQEYTGLHVCFIVGGPMPKYNGELRTLHVAHGRNETGGGDTWPQWDKTRFTKQVVDFMTEYLGTAFTPQQCAASSLTPDAALAGAKYTIASKSDGKDSDSSGSEASELSEDDSGGSDSDSGSDSSDDEDSRPLKKKKTASAPTDKGKGRARSSRTPSPASPAPAPPSPNFFRGEDGLTYEQRRAQTGARNQALANQLKAAFTLSRPDLVKPAAPKRKRKDQERVTGPVRKSTRHAAAADAPTVPRPRPRPAYQGASASVASGSGLDHQTPPSNTGSPAPPSPLSTATTTTTPTGMAHITTTYPPSNPGAQAPPSPPSPPRSTATPGDMTDPTPSSGRTNAVAMLMTPPPTAGPVGSSSAAPSSLPPPPACPEKAPAWFVDAHAQMSHTALGPHFNAVLAAWIRVEAASRFEHGPTKLSAKNRPKQVANWIARARAKSAGTTVHDPVAYAKEWQLWWDSLQPEWRTRDEDQGWSVSGGYGGDGKEWGPLFHWGVNGVLSVVASLYFWGIACADEDSKSMWESAASDVGWMLEGLAIYYEKWNRKF